MWRAERFSDQPCLIAACKGCGSKFDEGDAMVMHHASTEEVVDEVKASEWAIGPSGVRCPRCGC
jgi:hypothetical protein